MINNDTRHTIKFLSWLVAIIIAAYLAVIAIFAFAGKTTRTSYRQVAQLAQQKTAICHIQTYYHLARSNNSYALKGTDKHGKGYYFIYLPKSKQAYILANSEGVSAARIKENFSNEQPKQQIMQINLGWNKGQAVWEVAAKNTQGRYLYVLYKFKDGTKISEVANL